MNKYFIPAVLVGLGVCIIFSPIGQIPRTALAFGPYKFHAGFTLVVLALIMVIAIGNKR